MKKAAVIFPGLGYGPDRPLLYYAGKIAKECGYDLISIKYNGIDKATLRDISKMPDAFNLASQQAKEQLSGAGLATPALRIGTRGVARTLRWAFR